MSIRFGRFVLNEERRHFTMDGKPVPLSPKAFQLLKVLLAKRPNVVPREKLAEELWPDVAVEEANLRNLIAEIRGIIGHDLIRTVHRVGYAFEGTAYDTQRIWARLDDASRAYSLAEGTTIIGRDWSCAIALDARGVSREHARIEIAAGTVEIRDLESKNGTWVNGRRIESTVALREGDKIRIGVLILTFHLHDQHDTTTSLEVL